MKKVITYGTFDLFHYGHANLLRRAKELGDYLIVGVTTEGFDASRGKLNVRQPLMERMRQVRESGYADEIILEEYEGQKIEDIMKYGIDVFAVGSDWKGAFDYLGEYCEVVYIDRTEGISSTQLREEGQLVTLGVIGRGTPADKLVCECRYVGGLRGGKACRSYEEAEDAGMFEDSDAVYVFDEPARRGAAVRRALEKGCHVMCESPISLVERETSDLYDYAERRGLVLFEALKTAYFKAFSRLVLLVKGGAVGSVKSIDVTCTSMEPSNRRFYSSEAKWGSLTDWGPFVLLPIFKIFGTEYSGCTFASFMDEESRTDMFTQASFSYPDGVAVARAGYGVKSEGSLVISGTSAYIYVPAPWWKTDYFEIRHEDFNKNRRYFYAIDGEGIRYELSEFLKLVRTGEKNFVMDRKISEKISGVMEKFFDWKKDKAFI